MGTTDQESRSRALPAWQQRSLERVGHQMLQRSNRVVKAARQLVAAGGLEAITLRPLLEKSGLSRRAFYDRFAGMDDVLLALFEDTMARSSTTLRKKVAGVEGALAKMERLVRSMASMAQHSSDRVYMLAMTSEHVRLAEHRPNELSDALLPVNSLMTEILEQGLRDGEIREADPLALAETVHSLVSTEIHRNLFREVRHKRWIDELWTFCENGISAR